MSQPDKKKKRKKRNKKKKEEIEQPVEAPKKKVDDEDAYLDSIIKQTEEEKQATGVLASLDRPSVLSMDRAHFNYKKELKALFAKSAQAYGALGLDEEEKEEKRNRGAGQFAE